MLKVSAPGKIIISGEHAVVYGYPALAGAIDKRLTIDELGKISSEIPIGSGMGSSAAFSVARAARRVGVDDLEKVNRLAYKAEKKFHGTPSGIDNTVSTYGGLLWYRKESGQFKTFKQIAPKIKFPKLYLINTGKPVESTKEMVENVAGLYKARKKSTTGLFGEIEAVTRKFLEYSLGEKDDLGRLVRENERLLEKLGVVSELTKAAIRSIEEIGGFAKVTGAGGRKKGSGMVLIYHKDPEKLSHFAKNSKLDIISVKIGEEGVRIEK